MGAFGNRKWLHQFDKLYRFMSVESQSQDRFKHFIKLLKRERFVNQAFQMLPERAMELLSMIGFAYLISAPPQ